MKLVAFLLLFSMIPAIAQDPLSSHSHPRLHIPVLSGDSTLPEGPVYYVDVRNGSDDATGTKDQPWQTIQHALYALQPGDTLLLREGIYYENVYCSISGTADQPIVIRGYPGETVILDGGLREFQDDPQNAWEPGEAEGEYVSTRSYRNIRDVLGLFADSDVGLQTYWHLDNLVSKNELASPGNRIPYYAGPGIYYDRMTGKIHCRLAHTDQQYDGFVNYRGETDPRKLPLVVAPFRSVPLFLDQAMHLRIQDLIIRGGGLNTVVMNFAVDVEFDYVTIFGGTYCLRAKNSGPVRIANSGIYGQIPPWGWFSDNALQTYNGTYYDPWTHPPLDSEHANERENRNVARLPTHALLVTEGMEEYDVFAFPYNNHWEIVNCEFADGHDGIYLNARHSRIHHSFVYRIQDDGFYLSSPTPSRISDDLHISHNYIAGAISPFGAHLRGNSQGKIYVYNNVVDMRYLTQMRRATPEREAGFVSGQVFLAHGRGEPRGMESIGFYHNTFITRHDRFGAGTTGRLHPESVREVLNNIFVHVEGLQTGASWKLIQANPSGRVDVDGNLHWGLRGSDGQAQWIEALRDTEISRKNQEQWGGNAWEVHGGYADPLFVEWNEERHLGGDYRLQPQSPARDLAVQDYPSLQKIEPYQGGGAHAGALQGNEPLRVGINGRVIAGQAVPTALPSNQEKE